MYVADRVIEADAPSEWTMEDMARNHLAGLNIVALCPVTDADATIISCGPDDVPPIFPDAPDFEVRTQIEVPSGMVGIYGWPWEFEDEYDIEPGVCYVLFQAFSTALSESGGDYYCVRVSNKKFV